MNNRSLLLGFLIVCLSFGININQNAIAKNFTTPVLVVGQAEQAPPTDAITEKYGFTLVSELAAGRTVSYALLEKFGNKVNTDPELNHYVNLVGQSLAKVSSSRPQVDYKFGIIDTDEINAFACPGGYVFVTTGLLKVVYDENELAAVLGHEIGHIEHGDGLKDLALGKNGPYKDAKWDEVENNAALVGDIATSLPYAGWYASYYSPKNMAKRGISRAIGSIGGGYGGYVARSAAYSATDVAVDVASEQAYKGMKTLARKIGTKYFIKNFVDPLDPEIEFQADNFSVEALSKAGYDPRGIAGFLETIDYIKSSQASGETKLGGTQGSSESSLFTYRHPPVAERIEKVDVFVGSGSVTPKNPKAADDKFFLSRYTTNLKRIK